VGTFLKSDFTCIITNATISDKYNLTMFTAFKSSIRNHIRDLFTTSLGHQLRNLGGLVACSQPCFKVINWYVVFLVFTM